MSEPQPIDHMDTPGEYRQQVRAGVLNRVGGSGRPVADRAQLVGSWDVTLVELTGPQSEPTFVYRLGRDGTAAIEVAGQADSASAGEWRLNPDGTFSLLLWCPPMPEFGIDEPQRDEDRRHLAALKDGRIVAWNGDGSSVLLLSPRSDGGRA
jgi:hypothetical protein